MESAEQAYGRVKRCPTASKKLITSPEIQNQVGYIHFIGGATQLACEDNFTPSFAALATFNKMCCKARQLHTSVETVLKEE